MSNRTWPIETEDDVEALARECDWDNRKYMTVKDYTIWCERMRKFARLAALSTPISDGCEFCIDGLQADGETHCPCRADAPAPAKEWRCFHCDEVFLTANDARLHFGMDQCSDPACKIKLGAEKSLLVALRRAETELQDAWEAIHNENTEAAKAYYAQQSRHGEQLRAAEELGFERGIKDSTTHIAALEEQALRDRKLRDEAQQDALLWKYSVATDDHPPLLVTIWNQRKEALRALQDLCEAYATCNGEDHPAYVSARAAISGQMQADPLPSALASAAYELASWAACINWRGGENQKEWLDDLRQHIECVQALCKPYLPKSEAQQ